MSDKEYIKWPKPSREALIAYYGNPDNDNNGQADPSWESSNLTYITPPYQMFWSWSMAPVKRIKLHKKCAGSLIRCLTQIESCHTPSYIREKQLDQCGGAYNFRLMRGGNLLSMHSYGCAIDLAPSANPMGRQWKPENGMMPASIVEIFADEGWKFGGAWGRPDAMHFEATG